MSDLVLYVHGRGGSAEESRRYEPLFPDAEVVGLEYEASAPREAGEEIRGFMDGLGAEDGSVILIANSIGAYFCMDAGIEAKLRRAYFISPIVDMERLILDMMAKAGVTEEELREKGAATAPSGETLSWEHLSYTREHPLRWDVPTLILYGGRDQLTPLETVTAFAKAHGAGLTVMEEGEHWFHTEEQLRFLDDWIRENK